MNGIELTLGEIAARTGGEVQGDESVVIRDVASLQRAGEAQITFVEGPRRLPDLERSRAAAAVVPARIRNLPAGRNLLKCEEPLVTWSRIVEMFRPRVRVFREVSEEAFVSPGAEIAPGVGIGPGTYVGPGARIGKGTEIYPGCFIGAGSTIGEDCILYAGVRVYHSVKIGNRVILHSGAVIGADGYGFTPEKTGDVREPIRHRKVPQVGTVVIEDDVEIGANTTIDRAALDETVVGRGTKIDNLVMIGHNCRIGKHCLIVAQVGISGSVEIGDYVTIGGQAGIAGHIKIGSQVKIGAQAGVMKSLEDGSIVLGAPALPAGLAQRAYAQIQHLPEFRRKLEELARRLDRLEEEKGLS